MLFWKAKPALNNPYPLVFNKYHPSDEYYKTCDELKKSRLINPTVAIMTTFVSLSNDYIKYLMKNEKEFIIGNDNFLYQSTFNYFVLLYTFFLKKYKQRYKTEYPLKDFININFYYIFNEFRIDTLNYFSKNGDQHSYKDTFNKDTFKEYHSAGYIAELHFREFINEIDSLKGNEKNEIIEALYVSLIEKPSFSNTPYYDILLSDDKRALILKRFKSSNNEGSNSIKRTTKISKFTAKHIEHLHLLNDSLIGLFNKYDFKSYNN